jgi:hypothetical protein
MDNAYHHSLAGGARPAGFVKRSEGRTEVDHLHRMEQSPQWVSSLWGCGSVSVPLATVSIRLGRAS